MRHFVYPSEKSINGLFHCRESVFVDINKLKRGEPDFDFDEIRSFVDKFKLFGKEGVFEFFELDIRGSGDFKLVVNVISEKIDDEFIRMFLIKGKIETELLNDSIAIAVSLGHLHRCFIRRTIL